MSPFARFSLRRRILFGLILGIALTLLTLYFTHAAMEYTSTDAFCESCHVHPHATESWKLGPHYRNAAGFVTHCVDCHLPPSGREYYFEKTKAGARDLYGYYFKDLAGIDWEAKSTIEAAREFTFDSSCSTCHVNMFPMELSAKGVDAHLHYGKNREELRCINCHLHVGHFDERGETVTELQAEEAVVREMAPLITELPSGVFSDYSEKIPGTDLRFEMVAIEGGTFTMGSPESDPLGGTDERPPHQVRVSRFWMGRTEVSWAAYDAFYAQTATRGKNERGEMSDAITGPTPPYGSPDQGWGKGSRPAITMTHYAAQKYCEWLSAVTGRTYRLPAEAEWEYACRAGTGGSYFFVEETSVPTYKRWLGGLFGGGGVDEELLGRFAWYAGNSSFKTHPPDTRESNRRGLQNMLGNVREFCLDWYDPTIYSQYAENPVTADPKGPSSGQERVVRGGSFKSEPAELRSAARDHTRHDAWLKTDPQTPKSVWWYSDVNDVGFRIVREFEVPSGPDGSD